MQRPPDPSVDPRVDPRIDPYIASPAAMAAMLALEVALARTALEPPLLLLARLRTSQMNGCAWCIDLEYGEARRAGERPRRLGQLALWRDSVLFTARESAALAWAEFLMRPTPHDAPAALATAGTAFTDAELAELSLVLCATHGWNRFGRRLRRPLAPLGAP